ncbi:hypothetical protein KGQ19_08445 [Catenulispora sp. NL8]|uniref:Uncharacterized protein n=1 Tax=Catenulispora pinistramenti TaxID=2705254 RepID=A0ABS5KLH8_9ACTN|nr:MULTISPECIES: hypothetical protein [Catenulispora]MBS2546898.1 hypothetical protein [Catenulispora pinistramenti]
MNSILRYWGYLAALGLVLAWTTHNRNWVLILVLSVVVVIYSFFRAPAWCGAPIRKKDAYCRNNAYGLLMGCHLRQHRWEKLKMTVAPKRWRELVGRCLTSTQQKLAVLAGIAGSISTMLALIKVLAKA